MHHLSGTRRTADRDTHKDTMTAPDHAMADAARSAVSEFLDAAENAPLLRHLEARLGLTRRAIEAGCLRYTLDSFDSANDIYDSAATHVAMWIEYQGAGGIHARRQAVVLEELQRARPLSIVDIGFGAPTRYLRDYVLATPGVRLDLLDKYAAAIEVGRAILSYWGMAPSREVGFAVHDMDADPPLPGRDCYLMLDSIEHAADADACLRAITAAAAPRALFLFHLPIGPKIPSHSIAWASDHEAVSWLNSVGLDVSRTELILPNPQVDVFARHEVKMSDLFVVARKR